MTADRCLTDGAVCKITSNTLPLSSLTSHMRLVSYSSSASQRVRLLSQRQSASKACQNGPRLRCRLRHPHSIRSALIAANKRNIPTVLIKIKMSTSSATIACLCKGVRATVTGTDKGPVVCHCRNCREITGSAFAHNHRYMNASMSFEKGEELVKEYRDGVTKSGNVLGRNFCSNCVS